MPYLTKKSNTKINFSTIDDFSFCEQIFNKDMRLPGMIPDSAGSSGIMPQIYSVFLLMDFCYSRIVSSVCRYVILVASESRKFPYSCDTDIMP